MLLSLLYTLKKFIVLGELGPLGGNLPQLIPPPYKVVETCIHVPHSTCAAASKLGVLIGASPYMYLHEYKKNPHYNSPCTDQKSMHSFCQQACYTPPPTNFPSQDKKFWMKPSHVKLFPVYMQCIHAYTIITRMCFPAWKNIPIYLSTLPMQKTLSSYQITVS